MTTTDQAHDYFTLPEIVARYRTTEANVRYWRHIGYGPQGVRVGARVLYPRSEVERFDRELQQQVGAHASDAVVTARSGTRGMTLGRRSAARSTIPI